MIRAENLTKAFGDKTAVDHISFDIPQGQVVGFLGPNGAGKTTTMRLLTSFLPPDEGRAELMGLNVAEHSLEVRRKLGYLPENNPLYDDFETTDTLHTVAKLHGISDPAKRAERVKAVVKSCGLKGAIGKKCGELSKGYRQRLGLAQAIIHDPAVLILDEPTSGLDPNQVQEVRGLISELKKEKTVLLSTHILSEVTATCDRVLIIHAGKIVADGAPSQLGGNLQNKNRTYVELKAPEAQALEALKALPGVLSLEHGKLDGFILESDPKHDLREAIFRLAVYHNWPILALKLEKLSLEEIFRKLTKTGERGQG